MSEEGNEKQVLSVEEVSKHTSKDDCWLIIGNAKTGGPKVYNVTTFLDAHPGGVDIILDQAGKNADAVFEDFGHSRKARRLLENYHVGHLEQTKKKNQTRVQNESSTLLPVEPAVEQGVAEEKHGEPVTEDFYWSATEEPHASRRKEILEKYPQIKELYGYDPNTKFVCIMLVCIQVFMAYAMTQWVPFWVMFIGAYVVGGTCNHMVMLAMHELSHNLLFKEMFHNRLFSLFVNLPIGLPAAISFKRYHLEHHKYQGEDQIDVDIPTNIEGRIFQGRFMKFLFVMNQIFFYALRPLLSNPKKPSTWEIANTICCLGFDAILIVTIGPWSIFYLLLCTYLGAGLHPVAGHFISEHYVMVPGAETYSYYGPLNIFAFNVGYHNEHHDFPNIPGSRLPQVRQIAAEYYDPLPQCESWPGVIYRYIMDPNVTAFSRVKRHTLNESDLAALKETYGAKKGC